MNSRIGQKQKMTANKEDTDDVYIYLPRICQVSVNYYCSPKWPKVAQSDTTWSDMVQSSLKWSNLIVIQYTC